MKKLRKTLSCNRTKKQMLVILTSVMLLMAPVMGQAQADLSANKPLPASKYRLPYFGKAKVLPGSLSDGIRFRIDDGAFTAEVLSARDGVVSVLNRNEKEGAVVELKHTDGETTQYAHLGAIALSLHVGDTVKVGGLIGFQGKLNSDDQSNLLHFTIVLNIYVVSTNMLSNPSGFSLRHFGFTDGI